MIPRPESKDNNISQLILQISFYLYCFFIYYLLKIKSKIQVLKPKFLFFFFYS